jgi:type VI secretion system protein ImpK
MPDDDPFGLYAQTDRTVVMRPRPGGRRPAEPPDPFGLGRAGTDGAAAWSPTPVLPARAGANPLLSAAVPILSLAPLLRGPNPPADPETLRGRLLEELDRYREAARAAGADQVETEQAAWALAALLDDIVLNTPWGVNSAWGRRGLVASVWSEVDAGERFFEQLARMQREPGRHAQVLEVFHRCLAMGFEGRYRVARATDGGADGVRRGLARVLADLAGPPEPTLSPHWPGVSVTARAPAALVPPWVIATAALVLLLALFTAFRYRLADYSGQIAPIAAALPPPLPVSIQRDGPAAPPPPQIAAAAGLRLPSGFLAEERRRGLVTVQESAQRALIRLTAGDLFAPGSAELSARYRPLVDRIGRELAGHPGRVLVTGYTDSVPLRRSTRFADNQELSEGRARTVTLLLARALGGAARLSFGGRGERDPIGDNGTAEGRARNRRVEIVLLKTAGA